MDLLINFYNWETFLSFAVFIQNLLEHPVECYNYAWKNAGLHLERICNFCILKDGSNKELFSTFHLFDGCFLFAKALELHVSDCKT